MTGNEITTVPDRSVRQTSSFVFAPRILGREQDKENIVEKLVSGEGGTVVDTTPMSVLAIVGMGGLGKTTLAQLVYSDTRISQSFDLCGWVCVSEYFDVDGVTRKILVSLTKVSCDHKTTGLLQGALVDHVKEKRVFLVLVDVWNERSDLWELLSMPMLASRRCVILVTTRNMAVARLVQTMPPYSLSCLSPHESWSLFQQTAFLEKETVAAANLVAIGRRITEKCKGLPLAIKAVGSMLRYETNEMKWKDALENELWDLEQSRNEVLPALELSYKWMPTHLKRCFVALSLYSKDLYLDEYRVVYLWKQLDLIQYDVNETRDEIGISYVKELVQRSLLQSYIHGQMLMHDLVHDLACFLAGEEFFRLEGHGPIEIPQDARYLSITPNGNKSIQITNAPRSLRAIIMMSNTYLENPEALFLNCNKYRSIHIRRGNLANASLDVMGGMKLLRSFTILGDEKSAPLVIPNSLFQLFNLREVMFGSDTLHRIGRLVSLCTLPNIYLSKCDCSYNIIELRNLNKLTELCICGLRNASVSDANEALLYRKKNLERLELWFDGSECSAHKERAADASETAVSVPGGLLLESLRPHHQNLRVLRLLNFCCEVYPNWLGNASFSKLTELWLRGFHAQHLPMLGVLPSLKYLSICRMEYVKQIGREFCSLDPSVIGFRSLTYLSLEDMCRLSEWSGLENSDFALLETLDIETAFELRSLPPFAFFLSLRNLRLRDCRNIVTFPSSDTLQDLSVIKCENLNEIPSLPSLRSLYLDSCENLNEIPSLPSLRSLYLHSCPSLVTCARFPSLTVLLLYDPLKEEIIQS